MIRIQRILFPTDFSRSADQALTHALYLALHYGAELHLLNIVALHEEDPHNPTHHFPDTEALDERLRQFVGNEVDAVGGRTVHDLIIKQERQRDVLPATGILNYAEAHDIDLIVMGTHGRRGFRHLLIGSVTEEVVRMAPCAVFTVRAQHTPPPRSTFRNVLAPVDFSASSKEALRVAHDMAASYQARLQVYHVWENLVHPAFYNMGAMSIKDIQPDIEDRTLKSMRRLVAEIDGDEVPAEYFTTEGHAARQILHFADDHDTDLIVIATHGLSNLEQFLLGSVAEKVIRRAPCPVLVVKPGKSLVVR